MWVKNFVERVYFNKDPLTEADYSKSRNYSIFEGSTARTIFTLTSGAFLAGFAKYLGADDRFNGIIGAMPVLAGVIQFFSPMVFEKLERRKFLISIFCLLHRLLLGLMVFIPLLVKNTSSRIGWLAVTYFVSYLLVSFISPAVGGWIIDLIPENIRGRYFGKRESYILAVVTVVTLIMGKVLDIFRDNKQEYNGFLIMFMFVIATAVVNFIFLSSTKEPHVKKNNMSLKLKNTLTVPLKDKKFRKIVVLFFLWNVAFQIGGPFFAVYLVTGLKLDYTYIMIMGLISTITNVVTVRLWGKIADNKSWVYTTKISIAALSVCHIVWFLVDSNTAFLLVPMLHVLSGIAWAGINISIFNIQFIFSPEEGRTVYLGFSAALGGLVGFISTLIGSLILGILNGIKLNLMVFTVGNMQIVFGISGILLAVCAAFVHYFIRNPD